MKILKLQELNIIINNTDPVEAQCLKYGFNRKGYDCQIWIGAGFVKGQAYYDGDYLFSFSEQLSVVALNIAIQKIVSNLFDNINKHASTKSTETGSGPRPTTRKVQPEGSSDGWDEEWLHDNSQGSGDGIVE